MAARLKNPWVLPGRAFLVHDRAIDKLLADLTAADFRHPETGHRFIYQLS